MTANRVRYPEWSTGPDGPVKGRRPNPTRDQLAAQHGGVRMLTVQEVAGLMRVSKMSIYRAIRAGDLFAHRIGRSLRVPETAVTDWITDTPGRAK